MGASRTRSASDQAPLFGPGSLLICRTCHQLKGPVPGRDDGAVQRCGCEPRWRPPQWGGDFDLYAEFCRCCGLELLRSGSRWSVWFCQPCKRAVVALNRAAARCVVPIGRHSLQNGVGARLDELQRGHQIDAFRERQLDFFTRVGFIDSYGPSVVTRNIAVLGFAVDADVPLADYLAAVEASTLTAEDGFIALMLTLLAPSGSARRGPHAQGGDHDR